MRKNLLLSMLALFCLVGGSAWAQTFTHFGLKFTVTDAEAKTVSVSRETNDLAGDIEIPASMNYNGTSYTVTAIENNAFYNTAITGITIPATVLTIGNRAFEGCQQLTNINILDGDKELAMVSGYNGIFYGVNSDKTVYVGRNLVPSENSCPFYSNVVNVTFGDQVTTIHRNLFQSQSKLSIVAIGKGVKTIEQYAFNGCGTDDSVGEMVVVMGENVTLIENDAFNGCKKLTSITLPSTLKNINGYAFAYTGLTGITIPASVDSIGNRGFGDCHSMASINIEASDNVLKMINGYNGSFNYTDADKNVVIGRNLWLSENGAPFINPTSVEFGEKVTTINPYLFRWCDKLSSVSIGSGVITIGEAAFYDAGDADDIGEMVVVMGENVTSIGADAFNGCDKLTSITLPSTLKTIYGYAFASTGLTGITIPASVDSIGNRGFGDCHSMASINIEASDNVLKMINGYYGSFNYADADKNVVIGRNLWLSENGAPFINPTSVEFGEKVTTINPYLFRWCDKLSSVSIGSGVVTIGEAAFYDAGDGEEVGEMVVAMGENVTSIGADAFNGCDKLTYISLPSTLKTIYGYAFSSSGLTGITIPASVDSIGDRAFGYCGNLTSIRIEDSAEPLIIRNGYYGTFAYSDAEKTVYVGRDLTRNSNSDRVISNPTSVEIGDQVTTINPFMFYDSNKLSSLIIGNGVKTIGDRAFYDSGDDDEVGEMVVTMGSNVVTIENQAFDSCEKMTSITLPSTLTTIGNTAFSSTGLTSISIPGSVTSIGQQAFGWTPLTDIRFEDGEGTCTLVNGYYGAFRNPSADYTLYLGRNIEYQENSSPFPNVTAVEIGPKVTDLPKRLFYDRDKLITVTGGENVATMGTEVYYECNNLESISPLGKNLKVLPESTFELCEKLDGIVLPDGLEEIQQWAFHRCRALTELTIPGSVQVMGTKADGGNGYRVFYENAAMKKLVFADSDTPLKYIETNSNGGYCRGMSALETLYVGRDIVKGEGSASGNIFYSGDNIEFGPSVTEIGTNFQEITASTVKAPWQTPIAIADNAFKAATYSNATLWLPGGTRQAYAEADGWKNFVNVDFASFIVSVEATQGGSLTVGDITVANGEKAQTLIDRQSDVTFQATPADNYDFTSITVNGEAVETEGNAFTYYSLLQDIDVKAIFTEKPKFDITATATGGTVSLNGATPSASQTVKVYRDTDVTLAIAAAEGYENPKVTVNGTDVTAQLKDNQLTIENIQEAQTIVVTFAKKIRPSW